MNIEVAPFFAYRSIYWHSIWIGLERIIISREILKSDVMDCIDGMGMGMRMRMDWIEELPYLRKETRIGIEPSLQSSCNCILSQHYKLGEY